MASYEVKPNEEAIVDKYLAQKDEPLFFISWVASLSPDDLGLISRSPDTAPEDIGAAPDRLLVVGAYRVTAFKYNSSGQITGSFSQHVYNIAKISSPVPDVVDIEFKKKTRNYSFYCPGSCDDLLQELVRAVWIGRVGQPQSLRTEIEITRDGVTSNWTDDLDEDGVEFGGFFDRYAATCVFYDLNPREHTKLLNLIRQNVAIEPRELLLSRISNLHKIDIRPLTQALKYNPWFTSLKVEMSQCPDLVTAVAAIVRANPGIRSVTLSRVGLASKLDILASCLAEHQALTHLDLSGNMVRDQGVEALAPVFGLLNLEYLNLSESMLRAKGVATLSSRLAQRFTLETLVLSDNHLGSTGTKSFCKSYLGQPASHSLLSLSLAGCNLDIGALSAALASGPCQNLQALDISNNTFKKKDAGALAKALQKNGVEEIDLTECSKLTPEGMAAILSAMTADEQRAATKITFDRNEVGQKGAALLARVIASEENRNLHSISLSGTRIGPDGILAIVEALSDIPTIRRLSLGCCLMPATEFATAVLALTNLVANSPLEFLDVSGDGKTDGGDKKRKFVRGRYAAGEVLVPLLASIDASCVLKELDVTGNLVGDDGLEALSAALETNTTLTALSCDENDITIESLRLLAAAVGTNNTLLEVAVPSVDIRRMANAMGHLAEEEQDARKEDVKVALEVIKSQLATNARRKLALGADEAMDVDLDEPVDFSETSSDAEDDVEITADASSATSAPVDAAAPGSSATTTAAAAGSSASTPRRAAAKSAAKEKPAAAAVVDPVTMLPGPLPGLLPGIAVPGMRKAATRGAAEAAGEQDEVVDVPAPPVDFDFQNDLMKAMNQMKKKLKQREDTGPANAAAGSGGAKRRGAPAKSKSRPPKAGAKRPRTKRQAAKVAAKLRERSYSRSKGGARPKAKAKMKRRPGAKSKGPPARTPKPKGKRRAKASKTRPTPQQAPALPKKTNRREAASTSTPAASPASAAGEDAPPPPPAEEPPAPPTAAMIRANSMHSSQKDTLDAFAGLDDMAANILDLANFSDDDTPIVLVDLKAKPKSPRERAVPVPTFTEVTPPSPSGGGGRPVDMSESDSSDGDADVDDDEPLPPSAAPARPPKKPTSTGSGDDAGGPSRPRASKPTNVPGLAAAPARPQRGRRKAPDAASGGDDLLPPRPARPVRPVVNTSGQRSVLGGLVAKERKSRRVSLLRGHSRRDNRLSILDLRGNDLDSLLEEVASSGEDEPGPSFTFDDDE